jgi:hypothetical protein
VTPDAEIGACVTDPIAGGGAAGRFMYHAPTTMTDSARTTDAMVPAADENADLGDSFGMSATGATEAGGASDQFGV